MTASTGDAATSGTTATTTIDSTAATTDAAGQATQTAAAQQTTADAFANWDGKIESLPADAQRIIRETRKEAGDSRAAIKERDDRIKAILAAAGIQTEEEDPVKVLESTKSANETLANENRTLRVQLALSNVARNNNADESLLVPVLAHKGELAKLDPSAADFTEQLDALVKQAVKDNPKLSATQAAGSSSVDLGGGSGDQTDIQSQIDAATKAGNHQLAIQLKRQQAYAVRA